MHSGKASDGPLCIILVQSSWIDVILASWLKIGKSSGAGTPEGWSLYLLKLIPRIIVQTCCSSISYIVVRVSTYRNNGKRMMGWVTISHRHNFPLLYLHRILSQNPWLESNHEKTSAKHNQRDKTPDHCPSKLSSHKKARLRDCHRAQVIWWLKARWSSRWDPGQKKAISERKNKKPMKCE